MLLVSLAAAHAFHAGGGVLRPAMNARPAASMLDGHLTSWIADAAILLDDTTSNAVTSAAAATAEDPSWFTSLVVTPLELGIEALASAFRGAGMEQAYGPAIIVFTIVLKALTFPLNKQQIESTAKMQAIQPMAKKLQDKYQNRDPARLNQELQKLYQDNQVNPLAGCLPALAQIPIFIGLYQALLALAKENLLAEPFLWIPSLEGPSRDYTEGIKWLTEGWSNGAPPLGWHDTLCYLVLPVALVISQYLSTALLTPKTDDPAQQQSQAILKFLPLMIGWFSLNVPSGLGLYWLVNNAVTTLTTVLIRQAVGTPAMEVSGGSSTAAVEPPKSQGFGRRYGEIVESTDAETGTKVTIKPPGAVRNPTRAERRSPSEDDSIDVQSETVPVGGKSDAPIDGGVEPASSPPPQAKKARKKKGGKKKK
ncbi:hypothetical protein AB1Y20_006771 [Prymnesium parvum]|mmetsp:Transcript_35369/g.85918  ORF Transcript_35369/g.85918 Transcript_35369/m.85918 type:complete len:423 (-) Transcript_35369:462-1730(-)